MVTLTQKQVIYQVGKEGETLKLSGSTQFTEDKRIVSFNGQIYTLEGAFVGNFYYAENESGKTNKSMSDIDTDKYEATDALLDEAISELKEQVEEL